MAPPRELSPKQQMKKLLDYPEVDSWRTIMSAFQTIYQKLESGLRADDCTIPRFQILFHLYFDGPLPAAEIARKLLVTRGNISMFLRRLQDAGFVEISKKATTGKRPRFCLSKRGERFFETIFPAHIKRVRTLMPALDRKTLETLRSVALRAKESQLN